MRQLMHSFRGTTAPQPILDAVARGEITAFCLFAYNVDSPQQVSNLTASIRAAARDGGHPPPIIGIDQEGGQLIAIGNGATELPGNMALGATRSPDLARQAGEVLGRELLAMGINMNFAPSVDVNINPQNPVIGVRAFSDDPLLVGELGAALITGMQSVGVLASAKHFPGHGDTVTDSHHATPTVHHPLGRIHDVELKPFEMAIAADVGAIMSSHIVFTALDINRPATISYRVMTQLLRQEMGYTGLTITDAMDMHAVASLGAEFAVREAILAGNDLVLLGHLPDQLAMGARLKHLEFVAAVNRIANVRARLSEDLLPMSVVGSAEHIAIAQQIADQSITVVRESGRLPLTLHADATIGVIAVQPSNLTPADTSSNVKIGLADAIRARHNNVIEQTISHEPDDVTIRNALAAVGEADVVVVGTINAEVYHQQAELVAALHKRGQSPIVVALRTPYDIVAFPFVQTYLCAYGIRPVTIEAIARVLFGEIAATGKLPCVIPNISQTV